MLLLSSFSEIVKVTQRSCSSPSRPWPLQIRLPRWPWTWWESSRELQSETGHLSLSVTVWTDPIRIFDSVLWETTVSEIFTAHVRAKEECIYALPGICICPKDLNSHKSNCHLKASLGHFSYQLMSQLPFGYKGTLECNRGQPSALVEFMLSNMPQTELLPPPLSSHLTQDLLYSPITHRLSPYPSYLTVLLPSQVFHPIT